MPTSLWSIGMKDIVITAADRAKWVKEEEETLLQISKLQSRLANIRRKRELVELVSNDGIKPSNALVAENGVVADFTLTAKEDVPESFGAAIERIAKNSPEPISKKELKLRLGRVGHDKGNTPQFYTTLKRLKDKKRISVLADGRVWRPSA
jgi:hypothetical protein